MLVVGLDKVVKTREDAALQTKCMGLFGLEAMLLNLRQREDGGPTFDSLPPAVKAPDQRWHVILLDNGRSRMLSGASGNCCCASAARPVWYSAPSIAPCPETARSGVPETTCSCSSWAGIR